MRLKRSSPLWEYLEASGVLEKGTDEEIKAVKREYRKKYLLSYKRTKRNDNKEYTISLRKGGREHSLLIKNAKVHSLTVPTFIYQSALAYIEQKYLVPNPYKVAELGQMLSECLNEIRAIATRRDRFFWDAEMKLERVEKRIIKLEESIDQLFRNPINITEHDYKNKV